jgi:ABC-2 type transport system ATP-binding protein
VELSDAGPLAIRVENVSQRFSLRHEKTLKGLVVNTVRGTYPSKETFLALDDVSVDIPVGATLGLIGHNGSGKSTLLKIIGGVLTPTSGQVTRRGRLAALLELGAGFHGDLSGRENVFLNAELLGLSRSEIARKFDEIVAFSGVEQFIDTPMKFYSSGMFVRLGFAVAVHTEPDVLLVDEVLAVGDEQFQAKCLDVIRRFQAEGRTIVLVTHNTAQVEAFCDDVVLLHHGVLRGRGAPAEVIPSYRELLGGKPPSEPEQEDPNSPRVEIAKVEARNLMGRSLVDFEPGDSLVVDATYRAEREVPGFVGWVGLYRGKDLMLGVSTRSLGVEDSPLVGDRTIRFELPELFLGGGSYRLALNVASSDGSSMWDVVANAAEVRVDRRRFPGGPTFTRAEALVLERGSDGS